jgi:hypothetical protein
MMILEGLSTVDSAFPSSAFEWSLELAFLEARHLLISVRMSSSKRKLSMSKSLAGWLGGGK